MSKRLEDFISANKSAFNDLEPRMELWERIEQNLDLQPAVPQKTAKTFSLGFVLKVAATIIVTMGVCCFIYISKSHTVKQIDLADINPTYAKQQMHYASLVEAKRNELKSVAKTDPQLYKEFSHEIAKMDSAYKRLNSDLATSPNQERILRAMIRNLQIQTEVLNQQLNVIEQYNQMVKEHENETKNI